jgi:phage recombination protein Bet
MSGQLVTTQVASLAKNLSIDATSPQELVAVLKATAFRGQVTDAQMLALLVVANQYGLNPWTKEIYAFPDKNNGIVPVVGVDGWSRIINSHSQFDGMEFNEADDSIECIIFRKDRSHPIKVREYMAECKRNGVGPWQSHPRRMLRHKALIQCARLAFGFVGIYDQDEAERIVDGEYTVVARTTSKRADVQAAIPADSEERDLLMADMLAIADNGVAAFRQAWKDLPQEKRALVRDQVEEFKARAERADAQLQEAPV